MNDFVKRVIELAIQIQQIPAPTFQEEKRAEFIRKLFVDEQLQDVCMDETGNVLARLPGKGEGKAADRQCSYGHRLSCRRRTYRSSGAPSWSMVPGWEITRWASRRCSA